jgi:membrane protein DedA with SNARE-associated domain
LIHISPKHLKWADDWFERYGTATVFFSRMLPIIRTFISLPAGVAKMPFWRFSAFTLLGSIPWVLALAIVGEKVGDNWEQWRHKLDYLDYLALAAIVIGIDSPRRRVRQEPGRRGLLCSCADGKSGPFSQDVNSLIVG